MASAMISSIRSVSGNQPAVRRINEKAAMTFLAGVPVQYDTANAGVQEWDGATVAFGIAGVSKTPGSNLTTTGVAKFVTLPGGVPNQPAASKIARGAPYNDGRVDFEVAGDDTVFYGQVGPAQTPVAGDIGKQYGMTKDSDGHWYVDRTKATAGTNTVVTVVKLDTLDTTRGVHFVFNKEAWQLLQ